MPEILDANNRAELSNRLADKTFASIVIGGAITGAGILRGAAPCQPEELAAILRPVATVMAEESGWGPSATALQVDVAQGRFDFDNRGFRAMVL